MKSIDTFFTEYRSTVQIQRFFDLYRAREKWNGSPLEENFLIGSELVRHWEERWCRVLRWLLHPPACPSLARQFQQAFCGKWANCRMQVGKALVVQRERRTPDRKDRFDITLTGRRQRVIIETKVYSRYDPEQHDRYTASLREMDAGIYITPDRLNTHGWDRRWTNCTWADVAHLLMRCLDGTSDLERQTDEQRWAIIARDFISLIQNKVTA